MKAIHNHHLDYLKTLITVVNKAKIQNESNSQLLNCVLETLAYCCQQSKDTK